MANASAEWFTRVWTVQEMALASKIVVMRGTFTMSWVSFADILQWLAATISHGPTSQRPEYKQFCAAVQGLEMRIAVGDICYKPYKANIPIKDDDDHVTKSLITLLMATLRNNSTNPMDKVFGLYSLLPQPDARVEFPRICYLDDCKVMYMEFAKTIMKLTGSLWILLFVEDRTNTLEEDLPSWAPDWSQPLSQRAGPLLGHLTTDSWKTFNYGPKYTLAQDNLTLTVTGVPVDAVETVSKAWCIELYNGEGSANHSLEDAGNLFSWLEFVFEEAKSGNVGQSRLSRWQAFLEAMSVGTTSTCASLQASFPTNVVDLIMENLHPLQKVPLTKLLAPLHGVIREHQWCKVPRRLVRTRDGHLGLCTAQVTSGEGDEVVLLVGCPEPVVLRRRSHTWYGYDWVLVGVAVIEGMVGGKGWEKMMKGKTRGEIYKIG